eukprot:4945570-Alexandrium_andersonii.AAC.1
MKSTVPSWTQRWTSFVVLNGPTRWHPAPDSATWTVKHRRPAAASGCPVGVVNNTYFGNCVGKR